MVIYSAQLYDSKQLKRILTSSEKQTNTGNLSNF